MHHLEKGFARDDDDTEAEHRQHRPKMSHAELIFLDIVENQSTKLLKKLSRFFRPQVICPNGDKIRRQCFYLSVFSLEPPKRDDAVL